MDDQDTASSPHPPPLSAAQARQMGMLAESWPAADVLRWGAETFAPRITLATGFGVEGCVLIDLAARQGLPIDLFTLDTGLLFPETYALWKTLERRYGVTIRAVRPAQTVEEQARQHGEALWTREPGRCCDRRKVVPLTGVLAPFDAWVTAIRREQTTTRGDARAIEWDDKFALVKLNPLVRWTKADVWAYVEEQGVPYNPLHDRGYPSIGCAPCTSAVADGEDERAGRWRGRSRDECGLHVPLPDHGHGHASH
jgi:phosphoadenylyl-sulfate reductase (thioredoxin)